MNDKIEQILKKYWHEDNDYYSEYYYDDNNVGHNMKEELENLFVESGLKYIVSYNDCYDSCGYSCNMISVAWVENDGKLYMDNILIEVF